MDEQKLEQIQKELMEQIDAPLQLEKEIIELSNKIATDLTYVDKTTIEFDNTIYRFMVRKMPRVIFLLVADMTKASVVGTKYIPYQIKAEIDNNLSYKENLRASVLAFFRHITGLIKPEELDDDE